MQTYTVSNELYHHGILGMRWGVRRYQNKDGSLTTAGKRHRGADKSDDTSKKLVKKSKDQANPPKKKVSEMSDEELRKAVNRMLLEKQAYELDKQISALSPRKVSFGEKFIKSALNDVIAPAAKNVGKAYLEKMLKDKFGLSEGQKNIYDEMAKEIKNYNTKKAYDKMNSEKEANKKAQEASKKTEKAAKKAEKAEKAEKKADEQEQTVFGEGNSKGSSNKKKSFYDDVIDAEWTEVNNETTTAGQKYVYSLLEKPKNKK